MTGNNDNSNCGGRETEQDFATLMQSATSNSRAAEDFEKAQQAMEAKRLALTEKWTRRLRGKTLIDPGPVPAYANFDDDDDDDEKAEAEVVKPKVEEPKKVVKPGEHGGIAQGNVAGTTGAVVDKPSVVEGAVHADNDKTKTGDSVANKSSVTSGGKDDESDYDGGDCGKGFFSQASLPANRRILHGKRAPMTMDFQPDRLNIVLDKNGVCTEVFFV
ncbi:hypothetical protein GGI21_000512 [Coemansia aciculifera]|nr:hypothetical protein GGI21_000512 [Coemansia aciculifera]